MVSTEHDGIKYSLRPHGFKSRLLILLAGFVVSFGGALLAATSANGAAVPSLSPSDIPLLSLTVPPITPSSTPTPSPSPSPVIVTPTVTVTVTVTETVMVTETVSVEVFAKSSSETQQSLSASPISSPTPTATARPSQTAAARPIPSPSQTVPVSNDSGSSLAPWGIGVAALTGAGLATAGVAGFVRRRRYEGSHGVSNDETQLIPAYSVSDYDPNLGGHSGGSFDGESELDQTQVDLPPVSDEKLPDNTDTKPIPPVGI